ncbi:transposase [Pseudomonas syringae]|nr:transposase [Pseudomonas syringae]
MEERKVYTRKFKLRAASMVIDDECPVPDVCATLNIGPTALRRCVDQVRKERQAQSVKGTRAITEDQWEIQDLKARIKRIELEAEILKKATALLMSDPDRFR